MKFLKEIKLAEEYVGGLSSPGKMPCYSWSIPASKCHVGKKMHNVKGSVCSSCYALKGRYRFSNVQKALERRFKKLKNKYWADAIIFIINKRGDKYFRWFDSGDLQSTKHLDDICKIATACPNCKFWLPTREYNFVREYIESGNIIPDNLCIRLSNMMINGPAPVDLAQGLGVNISSVKQVGYNCPSSNQGNQCLDCRKCWNTEVFEISYKKH